MNVLIFLILFCLLFIVINSANILQQEVPLRSTNGKYFAYLQGDGNFLLLSTGSWNGYGSDHAYWATHTVNRGTPPYHLRVQDDGHIILGDSNNGGAWTSGQFNVGIGPYCLVMQDDGNFVEYDTTNRVIWQSNTSGQK